MEALVARQLALDVSERIARFEAEISRLESTSLAFRRHRSRYMRGFLALTSAGFACFAFGPMVGIWGSLSATVVSVAGFGMVRLRTYEFSTQITVLRKEIERMRASAASTS